MKNNCLKFLKITASFFLLILALFAVTACELPDFIQDIVGTDDNVEESGNGNTNVETNNNGSGDNDDEKTDVVTPQPVVKTVTFKADNTVVDVVEFTVGQTTSITEPEVPAKEHYVGSWESYELGSSDLVVNAVYNIDLSEKAGKFSYADGKYTSTAPQALAVDPNVTMANGTLSTNLKKSSAGEDSGIVFGLSDNGAASYWEGEGVSYYFFFVNINGSAYLAKSVNGAWHQLGRVVDITDYNEEDEYPLSVSFEDGLIRCFVGEECLVKYRDANPLTGTGVGYRFQETGTAASPIQYTSEVKLDELETEDYYIAAGNLAVSEGKYTTTEMNTLAVAKGLEMQDGVKYSVEYTPNVSHDGGLVFGLNDNGYCTFWEEANSGIYYYMLMVNFDGVILFAKIDGRTDAAMWTTVYDRSNIKNIDWAKTYTLSVVTNGNNVKGYADDMLLFSVDVADTFVGTKLGFRSAKAGACYSAISAGAANTGYEYYQRSGQFVNNNGTLSTTVDGGLVWVNNASFTTGSFSADIVASEASDTGLVFGASDAVGARWEEQPYYFFFVNMFNDALLAGPINGWTTIANGGNVSEYLNPYGQANNLKVEVLDGYVIKCYVNGHLVIKATAPENARLTGTYAGVRCVGQGLREFSNITISDTVTQEIVKKVIFKADGKVVSEVEYVVGETTSIVEPQVPAKENYFGSWEEYELGTEDIIVNAIYVLDEEKAPGYLVANGDVSSENDVYTTLTGATLAVAKNVLMEDNIKYSVEYTPNVSHDGGLVFGLYDNGNSKFWENANSGIYYYMLMVNFDGIILFAKIDGRTNAPMWQTLYDRSNIKNIDWKKAYTLSVVTNGNNVKGYVDDMLVFSVDVADTFVGTKLGFRSAVAGASYSTISVSPANTGYEFYQRSGQFVNNNGTLSTNVDGGLAWITNAEFTTGTFSADVTASRSSDTGLVFGASNPVDARWEEQPYYFFFVNVNNDALLAGPINGWTTIASGGNVSQYLNPYGQPNNLKVEVLDGYVIKCYVNGHLVIEAVAPENARLTGTYAGVRCVGEGLREFSNITITK